MPIWVFHVIFETMVFHYMLVSYIKVSLNNSTCSLTHTHTLRTEGKARKKLAIMRKLAGTTWGANEQILKTVYEGSVRPVLG